jgi:hypothetical protein
MSGSSAQQTAPAQKTGFFNKIGNFFKTKAPSPQQITQSPQQIAQSQTTNNPLFDIPTVPSHDNVSVQASPQLPPPIPTNTSNSVNSTTEITEDFIKIRPDQFVKVVFDQLSEILNGNQNTKFTILIGQFKDNISNLTSQKEIQPDQEKSEIYYEILVGFFIRIAYMLIDPNVTDKPAEFTRAYTFLCKAYEKILDNPQELIDQIRNYEEKGNCQEEKLVQQHNIVYANLNKQIEGLVAQVSELQARCPEGDCGGEESDSDDELECEGECEEGKKKDGENGLNGNNINEQKSDNITEKETDIKNKEAEIEKLKTELKTKSQVNNSKRSELEAKKSELDKLNEELSALKIAQKESEAALKQAQDAKNTAEQSLEKSEKTITYNTIKIKELEAELNALQEISTQSAQKNAQIQKLEEEIKNTKTAQETAQTEYEKKIQNAAEKAKTNSQSAIKEVQSVRNAALAEKNAAQAARNTALEAIKQTESAKAISNAEITKLKAEIEQLKANDKAYQEEQAKKAAKEAEDKAANLKLLQGKEEIYKKLITKYSELNVKLSHTEENSAFKGRFDALKSKCPLLFVNPPTTEGNSFKDFNSLLTESNIPTVITQIDTLNLELINLSEDVNGSVRVIVRIKPLIFEESGAKKVTKFNETIETDCKESSIIPIFTEQKGGECKDNIPFNSDYPQDDTIKPFEKFKVRITDTLENLAKITEKGAAEAAKAAEASEIEELKAEAKAAEAEAKAKAAEAKAKAAAKKPAVIPTPKTITYYKTYRNYYNIFSDPPFSNFGAYSGIPFIIDKTTTKPDINPNLAYYQENNLRKSFEQVKQGYSIVLFGYGYSGSGKTFTLLGSGNTKGVLQYGIEDMNYEKVELAYVFEEYSDVNIAESNGNLQINNLKGKIYQLYGKLNIEKLEIDSAQQIVGDFTNNFSKEKFTENFDLLSKAISELRKNQANPEKSRIKATINNPDSSRSHLYIVFKVTHKIKDPLTSKDKINTGYITIIDMAGRENPIKIIERLTPIKTKDSKPLIMLNQLLKYNIFTAMDSCIIDNGNFNYGSGSIQCKYDDNIKDKISIYLTTINTITYKDKYIKSIINEGFYINESINHLKYYLKNKADNTFTVEDKYYNKNTDLTTYNPEKYYIDVNQTSQTKTIITNGNCLTIPILKFLDTGLVNNLDKPTKFIMICAIRQEPSYANDVIDTLAFADSIKST